MSKISQRGFTLFLVILTAFCTATVAMAWAQFFGGQVGTGVVGGSVLFTTASYCPQGYSEYTTLRGRYLVGLPLSGTAGGTAGTVLTNLENREVAQHNHSFSDDHSHGISDAGHVHGISPRTHLHSEAVPLLHSVFQAGTNRSGCDDIGIGSTSGVTLDIENHTTGITVNSATVSGNTGNAGTVNGTPAPYVQPLACRKD